MPDFPTFSRFATWPTYAGYGEWVLLPSEQNIPGSKDNRIPEDQLPATQYAIRYNPLSAEVDIKAWADPLSINPLLWVANFGYTSMATIDASYNMWLSNGNKDAAMFEVLSSVNGEPQRFGPYPPTFDYSLGDQFKECMHYGMSGTFFTYVEVSGIIHFINMNSFYGYMEYISRARMKGFRLTTADITSVSYISGKGTAGNWNYKLTTTLRNDLLDTIDLSSDSVTMTVYRVGEDGKTGAIDTGIIVKRIEGQTIYVEASAPSDPTKDVPVGWSGGYLKLNKIIIIRNPLTLFCDDEVSGATISHNKFIKETSLGYETREQQIQDSGNVLGIYVSKDQVVAYLNTKISDPATLPADVDTYNSIVKYLEGDTIEKISEEGLVYGSFESGSWGMTLLNIIAELDPSHITLNISIGGGTTQRHNMHAGCLAGEFFVHGEGSVAQTYRVSRHIRRNVYELDVRSRTTKDDLVESLKASADIKSFGFIVESCRMWFINDLTFGLGTNPSPEIAAFWGHITSISTSGGISTVTLEIDNGFRGYSTVEELYYRFVQEVPPSSSFVQKWDDSDRGWYLNGENQGSYKLSTIVPSSSTSFDIALEGELPDSIVAGNDPQWWVSFDKKFEISGGYSYIKTPYIAIEGALGGKDEAGTYFNNVIIHGIYVGLPLREKLLEGTVCSVVFENGGIYPNIGLTPIVYISTARKGNGLSMCLNKFTNMKGIAYTRNNDPMMSLVVRRGTIDYIYDVGEYLVYYGNPKRVSCPVSGGAGYDQTISLTSDIQDHVITGITCKPKDLNSQKAKPLVVWEVKHGNYIMGFPSTSGIISTIATRCDTNKYTTEESDFFPDYKSGTFLTKKGVDLLFASNVENENVVNDSVITLTAKKNPASSPALDSADVHFVPRVNVVNNCTNQYVYPLNNYVDCIVYVKRQIWVRGSEGESNFKITGFDEIRKGKRASSRVFNPDLQIDEEQDGVFILSTSDYSRYAAGIFPFPSSSADDGKPITSITALAESDLYRFPLLVVPNITRCAYDKDSNDLYVVGYTNVRETSTSTDFNVLSLVFHRVNLLDLYVYPVYAVKGDSGYVFTYCNYDPSYKRIINAGETYQEFDGDKPIFTDANLTTGVLAIAVDTKSAIVISQQAAGLVFFLSDDHGSSWAYIDDISLINASGTVGSPSIRIYGDNLWLMFTIGSSLYLKIICMGHLISLAKYCKNMKSSEVEDSAYQSLKINVQDILNKGQISLISEVPDQQVSFDVDNEGLLHIIFYDSKGVRAIGSQDHGSNWNYKPVNF